MSHTRNLLEEVNRLQCNYKRLSWLTGLLAIVVIVQLGVPSVTSAPVPSVIEAGRFVIRTQDGRYAGEFGISDSVRKIPRLVITAAMREPEEEDYPDVHAGIFVGNRKGELTASMVIGHRGEAGLQLGHGAREFVGIGSTGISIIRDGNTVWYTPRD